MKFFDRVKAVFRGGKGGAAPTPSSPPAGKPRPPRKKKSGGGAGGEGRPGKAVEPQRAHGGPRKPRKKRDAPAGAPRRVRESVAEATPAGVGDWDVGEYQVPVMEGQTRFLDLDLPVELLRALHDLEFRYCTPIQAKSLPLSLDGVDVCGRAQTGTGKTAAFLLTIFSYLLANPAEKGRRKGYPRALIMAPTRELCLQVARDAEAIGKYTGLRTLAVYGGMELQAQRAVLRSQHVDVVVATPGRLLDFRQRQDIDFSRVELLVIDEADRMLDMGFIPDMRRIIYGCPPKHRRQTMLFSATLTPEVTRLAAQWMRDAATVDIEPEQVAAETIDQRVYIVTEDQKFTVVHNILRQMKPDRVIIFGNRRDSTERLCDNLRHQGLDVALLSGAVDQRRRIKVLENFRSGRVPILVATDVAGRGLHIDGIDLIINYNVPEQAEDYVHRIGRTGRVGEKGISITFADEIDGYNIPAVEEYMKQPLRCVPPPEEWLAPLPKAMLPRKRRAPREGGAPRGGRRGGERGGRGGPRRGGRR
ncbi:MAG: DEAD/DEAH box helicase [Lentisphaerae bacterium]|nr:DEAD/DEAH box helicase [Lentisphaerota bacterium]